MQNNLKENKFMKKNEFLETYRNKNKTGLIRLLNHNTELREIIFKHINISDNLPECLYCYYNNIDKIPTCPYCGRILDFLNYSKGYAETCGEEQCKSINKSKTNSIRKTKKSHEFTLQYSKEELIDEFNFYKNTKGNFRSNNHKFKIIKQFQQDIFYKNEKEFLSNQKNKDFILANRKAFLKKENISISELISGCKISGSTKSFSHFQPLWIKWFQETYNINSIFDPFGGWGHRLLGCLNLKKYIYNDIDKNVCSNIKRIIKYFDIKNTEVYSKDFRNFDLSLINDIDAWFTCPPYVTSKGINIEHYNCGDYSIEDYSNLMYDLIENWRLSSSKIFGLVIREDIFEDFIFDVLDLHEDELEIECVEVGQIKTSHLSKNTNRKFKEKLYIIKKI